MYSLSFKKIRYLKSENHYKKGQIDSQNNTKTKSIYVIQIKAKIA